MSIPLTPRILLDARILAKTHLPDRRQRVWLMQRMGIVNRHAFHRPEEGAIKDLHTRLSTGKWLWAHKPGEYAAENFLAARAHLEHGSAFQNMNLPPGHKPEAWTIESEREKEDAGIYTRLQDNGDWSCQ